MSGESFEKRFISRVRSQVNRLKSGKKPVRRFKALVSADEWLSDNLRALIFDFGSEATRRPIMYEKVVDMPFYSDRNSLQHILRVCRLLKVASYYQVVPIDYRYVNGIYNLIKNNHFDVIERRSTYNQRLGLLGEYFVFYLFKVGEVTSELFKLKNSIVQFVFEHEEEDNDPVDQVFLKDNICYVNCVKTSGNKEKRKSSDAFNHVVGLTFDQIVRFVKDNKIVAPRVCVNRFRLSYVNLEKFLNGENPFQNLEVSIAVQRTFNI